VLKKTCVSLCGILVCTLGSIGRADPITSFTYHVTNSTVITTGQSAVIGAQIQTYLRDNGNGTVTFHFENLGTFTDSITEVYFQDGLWLKPPPVISGNNSGVQWEVGANPAHLPGAGSFNTDVYLDSQSQPGNANGINNNTSSPYVQKDWLELTFQYVSGKTFADVINGLNAAPAANSLEIGFHATGYYSSASVVQYGAAPVPVGSTIPAPLPRSAFAGLVLLGLLTLQRRARTAVGL
jgi:hypothetical protein